MKDWTPESEKTVQHFLTYGHDLFIGHVEKFRGSKIKVPKDDRKKLIYQADVFTGERAVELGYTAFHHRINCFRLVDGIGSYHDILKRDFPDAKIVDSNKERVWDRIRHEMKKALVFDLPKVNA